MLRGKPITHICKINYAKTECPICHNIGNYTHDGFELTCKICGAVIETPYNYTAGFPINQNIIFKIEKITRIDKK